MRQHHPRHRLQRPLHPRDTGGAGHPLDHQFLCCDLHIVSGLPNRLDQGFRRGDPPHLGTLDKATELVAQLESAIEKLEGAINHTASGDILSHAKHFRDEVIPAMNVVRSIADKLETIVPDDIWPLPTYQEMLFIK